MAARPPTLGRGRAGRGRAGSSQQPPPGAAAAPPPQRAGQPQPQPGGPPAGAWPRPPALAKPPTAEDVAGISRTMQKTYIGTGADAARGGGKPGNGNGGNGNGNGAGDAPGPGRGGMRGRRALDVEELQLRTRPDWTVSKKGSSGAKCQLIANYFELLRKPDWIIHQYRVDFSADEDRIMVRRAWLNQQKETLGTGYEFEGTMIFSSNVYCRPDAPLILTSHDRENQPIKITIKWVAQIAAGNCTYIHVFNTIVRKCMGKLDLQLVNRNLFDAKAAENLNEFHLTVWPGYETVIKQCEDKLLLNAEITHKVMRTDTAYKLFRDCQRGGGDYQANFLKAIIGQTVQTPYNNKTYRVDDVAFNESPRSTFPKKDGGSTTYIKYYEETYREKIQDPGQPLLVSKAKAKDIRGGRSNNVMLVPELCQMTGLEDSHRSNFRLMKALANVTHVEPGPRIDKLVNFNKRLMGKPEIARMLTDWGLQLSPDLIRVDGRRLEPLNIMLGGGGKVSATEKADWTRQTQDKLMFASARMEEWVVIATRQLMDDAKSFVRTMRNLSSRMGFQMPEPSYYEVGRDNISDLSRATDDIVSQRQPDLIMYCVSNVDGQRYSGIKKKCYIDRAINSQVITRRNLSGKNIQTVATKVAVQINAKLGGVPWAVDFPKTGAMVCGFDVCHDANDKSKSVGAFVASSTQGMTKWWSNAIYQTDGAELTVMMATNMRGALRCWKDVNQSLPSRIIFYRDGVGDGQLGHVHGVEVQALLKVLAEVYGDTPPVLTYIVVTKRINTRIILPNRTNPGPGVVVDDVITNPEKYDFFLISQNAKQGTVMPTCYNIIHDDSKWPADRIQRFTFMSTHLYYNLSSTVRVPAPVQYAHKLAFLVSQSLHSQPNVQLNDRLYFI